MLSTLACFRCTQKGVKIVNHFHKSVRFTNFQNALEQPTRGFKFFTPRYAPLRGRSNRSRMDNRNVESGDGKVLDISRIAIAAAAGLSLGCISVYGLSQSIGSRSLTYESSLWPEYVRERVRLTYTYVAGSAAIAACTAACMFRSPAICRTVLNGGFAVPIGMLLTTMATSVVCRSLPYPTDGSLSPKHVAWLLFSASIGASVMPICLVGGEILAQAALYTGGIVGALSLVAVSAPSDQFLNWGGPLAIGLGVVFISSLGSMFVSPASRLGFGLSFICLYGGLVVFSGLLLYNTQNLLHRAKMDPPLGCNNGYIGSNAYSMQPVNRHNSFDPINNSMHIFLDSINIFIRMVAILNNGKRK